MLSSTRTTRGRALSASVGPLLQTRGFRFGPWGNEPEGNPKTPQKRHRATRYRYMESLNRVSWDKQSGMEDARANLKKAMSDVIRSSTAADKVNVRDEGTKPQSFDGLRPGRNIEDVERDALDHLFRPSKPLSGEPPLKNIRKYLKKQAAPPDVTPSDVIRATVTESFIDPITNRRVSSFTPKTEDVDVHTNQDDFPDDAHKYKPVKWNEPDGLPKPTAEEESKNYEDLDNYKPSEYDDPNAAPKLTPEEESKNYKDLNKYKSADSKPQVSEPFKNEGEYGAVRWNEPDGLQDRTPEELSKDYKDLHEYGAVRWNEPDGLAKPTAEELSKEYKDLDQYEPVRWNEPDGLQKATPEELSKEYDDLGKYGAVRWNEPDGLQKQTPEELSKNYDDLDQYGPVKWNEPDGLQKETPEEASKHYEDLDSYQPVRWNEPDGLQKQTPEELSKNYEDLETYDGPRDASKEALLAYAESQLDTTQRGDVLPPKVEVASEDPSKEYKDLHEYGPVKWNEPDGLQEPTPEELSKNYDDLHLYGAVRWNEPDGLRVPTPEEQSKQYKDVHLYSAKNPEGDSIVDILGPGFFRRLPASERYKGLSPEVARSLDDYLRTHPEERTKDYKDLDKYASFDDTNVTRVHPEEASKQYEDLDKYEPQSFDSPCEPFTPAVPIDGPTKHDHLDRYDPQQFDSMDPDLDPTGAKQPGSSGQVDTSPRDPWSSHYSRGSQTPAHGIRADMKKLEEAKLENDKAWDAATESAQSSLTGSRKFTGNYARDFPEDFSASWTEALNKGVVDTTTDNPGKLEPALERINKKSIDSTERKQLNADPYSTTPQGLETSYTEECPTPSNIVKHYSKDSGESAQEPKTFKILAYDWKADVVRVAETTSSVYETTAQSPAEVITRISNPSKFFPFFAPLESQGYEIVSGTGDVLVFHKVRKPAADPLPDPEEPIPEPAAPAFTAAKTTPKRTIKPSNVNPVDMMGKLPGSPITGNFASPTGFVNYDDPVEDLHTPVPPPTIEPAKETHTVTRRDLSRSAAEHVAIQNAAYKTAYETVSRDHARRAKHRSDSRRRFVKWTAASVAGLYGLGAYFNWYKP